MLAKPNSQFEGEKNINDNLVSPILNQNDLSNYNASCSGNSSKNEDDFEDAVSDFDQSNPPLEK